MIMPWSTILLSESVSVVWFKNWAHMAGFPIRYSINARFSSVFSPAAWSAVSSAVSGSLDVLTGSGFFSDVAGDGFKSD